MVASYWLGMEETGLESSRRVWAQSAFPCDHHVHLVERVVSAVEALTFAKIPIGMRPDGGESKNEVARCRLCGLR